MRELTDEKIAQYLATTEAALAKLRVAPPEPSHLRDAADDLLGMARAYFADAGDFARKGDLVNAFACVNYAHGWLDAGARLGFWDVGRDDRLFSLSR